MRLRVVLAVVASALACTPAAVAHPGTVCTANARYTGTPPFPAAPGWFSLDVAVGGCSVSLDLFGTCLSATGGGEVRDPGVHPVDAVATGGVIAVSGGAVGEITFVAGEGHVCVSTSRPQMYSVTATIVTL